MPIPDLPFELWAKILQYVRNPIPEPRANAPRDSLLQVSLCNASLTCKLFHSICEPLLWKHIAFDRFLLFLPETAEDYDPPMRRLFALVETMSIEYMEKQPHISYLSLFRYAEGFDHIGTTGNIRNELEMAMCSQEILYMEDRLEVLEKAGGLGGVFPKLHTLAVGSILGGQDGIWRTYAAVCEKQASESTAFANARVPSAIFHRLCQSSNIRHLCVRGQYGPLMPPSATFASGKGCRKNPYTFTQHFVAGTDQLSLPFGSKVTWVSESPSNMDGSYVCGQLPKALSAAVSKRKAQKREAGRTDTVDVTVYCSIGYPVLTAENANDRDSHLYALPTSSTLPPILTTAQRNEIFGFGVEAQAHLRENSGLNDKFRWLPSSEAPACPACGTRPPP